MLYLLDANVLIDANRDYYPLQRVPEFWEWLAHHGEAGSLAVPLEIAEELEAKNDDLSAWIGAASIKKILTLLRGDDGGIEAQTEESESAYPGRVQ